jgi:K+-transporting ATPase KdpF subunit
LESRSLSLTFLGASLAPLALLILTTMKTTFSQPTTKLLFKKIPLYFLGILGINSIISPLVQASTGGILSRGQSYALGLLGLVTLSLFVYLFVVIFQPEKF